MHIILASSSPRRQMLLKSAGFELQILAPHVDETILPNELPDVYVRRLAQTKAEFVSHENDLAVVAADTSVVLDGEILGKPIDQDDARNMLQRLSGVEHQVLTGFAVHWGEMRHVSVVTTSVTFRPLSLQNIESYLLTQEPFDKAGSYGIQGAGAALIDRIEGSFTNVIGLPIKEVVETLHSFASLRGG